MNNYLIRQSNNKRIAKRVILWLLVAVGIGLASFGMVKLVKISPTATTASLVLAVSDNDWFKGAKDAQVVLVEYSDFQCPACKAYYPFLKKLNADFEGKIKFIYRHFPLPQHKNAKIAALVTEAAGKQGKFWEMHDLIFENQDKWSGENNAGEIFAQYAHFLGLDTEKLGQDLNSSEVKEKVENDLQSGIQSKVNSTPTFFLNGVKLQNPRSYDEFRKIIEEFLNAS
ncbi:MAG: hypothetical protein A3G49_06180 [Candidatus Sungbacteria bacterium RIFCSPLOWO2_12_FULL_41_11]|uniref:Thioredoxin domain-containing protein n=1 Tax=Candidatus Sungbacteria bacterium RIFCSPLOWO2_12_FULL_41_11 TaxID=1802286 RepID=A0A1G2LTB2_9BACT|nr:MAG: Protein-disulfide isomerase [Parcubacteria group bacterium GW2011_GWA2_42_14]OHA00311.1 MAG: hypothetical protein A3D41_05380 [Candidatus Sungbacteria bacterium RIFCSPHIGHO2_02_FULL_41_12b]OHA14021.1 MAG: hypothetical protein A3G49_06180 [Candidatus Sungbacteria bacterium RIFCSPLOWO2_12_FULL_41_11]